MFDKEIRTNTHGRIFIQTRKTQKINKISCRTPSFNTHLKMPCKKIIFMVLCICQGNLHKIKKEYLIMMS